MWHILHITAVGWLACCAGMFVGLMSDRGRGSIGSYVGNVVYSIVAMGMLATVSNAPDAAVHTAAADVRCS
jgi:hypothetical protein